MYFQEPADLKIMFNVNYPLLFKASSIGKYNLRWVEHHDTQKKDESFGPSTKFTIIFMYTGSQTERKRVLRHLCLKQGKELTNIDHCNQSWLNCGQNLQQ